MAIPSRREFQVAENDLGARPTQAGLGARAHIKQNDHGSAFSFTFLFRGDCAWKKSAESPL